MTRLFALGVVVRSLAIATVVSACFTSVAPRHFAPANRATGVMGTVAVTGGGQLSGELLAVNDTAYVMLIDSRVTVAPYGTLSAARFAVVGQVTRAAGEAPPTKDRRRLASYARFPYGIPAPAMAALLGKSGQTTEDAVGPDHR